MTLRWAQRLGWPDMHSAQSRHPRTGLKVTRSPTAQPGTPLGSSHSTRGLVPHHLSREPAPGIAGIAMDIGTADPAYNHLDQQLSLGWDRIRDFFYRPAVRPVVHKRPHGAAARTRAVGTLLARAVSWFHLFVVFLRGLDA